MPPKLALLLAIGFIVYLFRRDIREKPSVTGASWIFFIWMFLVATRPVSKWLEVFGIHGFGATSVEEGGSLDAFVFSSLIAAAIFVLIKRRVTLAQVIRDNPWPTFFILYCFVAIFWSDFPLVSLKRWIKVLGHPVMVVLLFTEPQWEQTLTTIAKRCSYILFPISIVWMKYFPALGRHASEYGGMSNVGIAEGKNELGALCLIYILLLFWIVLRVWKHEKSVWRRNELRLIGGLILMAVFCIGKAHSATSTFSLVLGGAIMLFLGLRSVDKRRIGVYLAVAIVVLSIGQLSFDIFGKITEWSGHESTIEGRNRLWEVLLQTDTNPIIGEGFESYWLGAQAQKLWTMPEFAYRPNQAHNGYLELYLNLGIVGLGIFAGLIFATFGKIRDELLREFNWGRFEMGCFFAILARNWTEAGFKGLSLPFFVLFIIMVNYRHPRNDLDPADLVIASEDQAELVHSGDKTWVVYGTG